MTAPERTLPAFPPSPAPEPASDAAPESATPSPVKPPRHDDPTRYGDWELSGKCVDF